MARAARIGVVGAGLIGGSIIKAALAAGAGGIVACDRDAATRTGLSRLGVALADSPAEMATAVDVIVVAVPPGATPAVVAEALGAAPGVVVTDAASVKGSVWRALEERVPPDALERFVPGHPLAGHESRGWRHADAALLAGAVWALCPAPGRTGMDAALRVIGAITGVLGARVLPVGAGQHDVALAHTSHMPHLVASALMRVVAADAPALRMRLSGGALRDATRVAGAGADLWADILRENAEAVVPALDAMIDELGAMRAMLAGGRTDDLARAWREGAGRREELARLRWSGGDAARGERIARSVDDLLAIGRAGGLITAVSDPGPPAALVVAGA